MHGTCEGESNTEAVYMQRSSYIAILLAILSRTMYYRLRNIEKKTSSAQAPEAPKRFLETAVCERQSH